MQKNVMFERGYRARRVPAVVTVKADSREYVVPKGITLAADPTRKEPPEEVTPGPQDAILEDIDGGEYRFEVTAVESVGNSFKITTEGL